MLDVWYPEPRLGPAPERGREPEELTALSGQDRVRDVRTVVVLTVIEDLQEPPTDAYDVCLRLHLLSHRLVRPHGENLDGMFGLLTNVVWTSIGPCSVRDSSPPAPGPRPRAFTSRHQHRQVPPMTDYVIPPRGVRIGEADRVRLGAHLAEGTTVMHEGFVNFNAGTLGTRWSRAASRPASWWATAPTWVAAPPSWARCPAAEHRSSAWANAV